MIKNKTYNPLLVQNSSYKLGDCPIAAVEYVGFSPNKIINIKSHENDIYENSLDYIETETIYYTNGYYPSYHYPYCSGNKIHYLLTDQYQTQPLFFQYELLFDAAATDSGVFISNIYRNNETIINSNDYLVQYSSDLLGNNKRYSSTNWYNSSVSNVSRIRILLPYSFADEGSYYSIEYNKSVFGITNYQKELIEHKELYPSGDYSMTSNGIQVNQNLSGQALYITKDPKYRLKPLDIISIRDEGPLSDKTSQWKLRLNIGSCYKPSGVYSGASGYLYNLEPSGNNKILLTNIVPSMVTNNILQVSQLPIYINENDYTYPNYKIETYDTANTNLTDNSGTFAININGLTRTDIKITSIDRTKGYIEFDTDFDLTDQIELNFYVDNSGFIILDNLELNPKLDTSGILFNINDYPNGCGIALAPLDLYPYIYDLSSTTCYSIPNVGGTSSSKTLDSSFFKFCELEINQPITDMIKLTDARRIGGGLKNDKNLNTWLLQNSGIYEKNWYTDIGYYDGIPMAHNSLIIIHIPDSLLTNMQDDWINYYKTFLDSDAAETKGTNEFKFYLNQIIHRYISAGTAYVILPTVSGVITGKILNLET